MLGLKLNHVSKRGHWRRGNDEPLSEPMMVWFTDAYMRRSASMSRRVDSMQMVKSFLMELLHS